MIDAPNGAFPGEALTDLISQASAILAREVARLPWAAKPRDVMAASSAPSKQASSESTEIYQLQVPLLSCAAPVNAGGEASATLNVANEEDIASDVTLYSTNFIADSGHEIPSLRVTIVPRSVTIPAKAQAAFEIKVAVSQQTTAGIYSGLIQAMGSKYVKAVLSVEVL
jgi:hypothetical protein